MKKLPAKDDFDSGFPLLIAFTGWAVLLGYLYYRYIQYNQDIYSLITSSGDNVTALQNLVFFLLPLISSIFGYIVNKRILLYKSKYINERTIKRLAEHELIELVNSLILSFVNALDAKSTWTKGHSLRVRHFCTRIALELELSDEEMELLCVSALLHDIGKIGTYDDILNKVETLTDIEFDLIKQHPANAVAILSPIKHFRELLPIIKGHHERMDGQGYPDGLVGDDIPFLARILCVADSYDAITSNRPYKKQMCRDTGLHEVQIKSGDQFDPVVVAALTTAHSKNDFDYVE